MATGGDEGDAKGLLPLLFAAEKSKNLVNIFTENSTRCLSASAGNHFAAGKYFLGDKHFASDPFLSGTTLLCTAFPWQTNCADEALFCCKKNPLGGGDGVALGQIPLLGEAEKSKKCVKIFSEHSARYLKPLACELAIHYPLGYEKRVVAHSPRESAGITCLRNMVRRMREQRLMQGEARLGRREDLLERREQRIEQREILADQKEARLHSTAVALEAEKKKHEEEKAAQAKKLDDEKKQADQQALDAAKKLEAADSFVTQAEKVPNVPTRMESIKKILAKGGKIGMEAMKGAAATAAFQTVTNYLKSAVKDELGLGGEDDSNGTSNAVATNGTSNAVATNGSNGVVAAKGPLGVSSNGGLASNGTSNAVATNGSNGVAAAKGPLGVSSNGGLASNGTSSNASVKGPLGSNGVSNGSVSSGVSAGSEGVGVSNDEAVKVVSSVGAAGAGLGTDDPSKPVPVASTRGD